MHKVSLALLGFCVLLVSTESAAAGDKIQLSGKACQISIDPSTLATTCTPYRR